MFAVEDSKFHEILNNREREHENMIKHVKISTVGIEKDLATTVNNEDQHEPTKKVLLETNFPEIEDDDDVLYPKSRPQENGVA